MFRNIELRNLFGGTQPRYALSGYLVYAQGGSLMAVPFDAHRGPDFPPHKSINQMGNQNFVFFCFWLGMMLTQGAKVRQAMPKRLMLELKKWHASCS